MIYRQKKNTPLPSVSPNGGQVTSSPVSNNSNGLSSASEKPVQQQQGFDANQLIKGSAGSLGNQFNMAQSSNPELYASISNSPITTGLNEAILAYDAAQGQGATQANINASDNQPTKPLGQPELGTLESMGNSVSNFANRLKGSIPRLNIVAADVWENVLGKELSRKWYEFEGRDIDQERNNAYSDLEQLSNEMKPTLGIVNSFERGNIKELTAGLVNSITSIGASAIPAMATGGAGIFTEMTGDAIVDFNKEKAKRLGLTINELYQTDQADLQVPALIGATSGALELIGLKGVNNLLTNQIKGAGYKKALMFFGETQKEGLTELLQGGLEAANKAIGQGKTPEQADKEFVDAIFSRQGLESYLQGVFGASGAGALGSAQSLVTKPSSKNTIASAIQNIGLSEMNLANENLSPQSRSVLENQIDQSISEIAKTVDQEEKSIEKLDDAKKNKVAKIDAQIDQLNTTIADPNVSDDVKANLQSQITALEAQSADLIDTPVNQQSGELSLPSIKQQAVQNIDESINLTEQLSDELVNATTPEQVSAIKVMAEAAVEQGIKSTQTLDATNKAELGINPDVKYQKGDSVSVVDELGETVSGLFKEMQDGNKMVIGVNEDGIYKERTVQLPVIEEQESPSSSKITETQISTPETQGQVIVEENAPVAEPSEFEGKSTTELAQMYNEEVNNPSLTAKERAISSMPFFINRDSYIQFNDANNITSSKARSYFRNTGQSVDQIAQEINNEQFNGEEVVTPQDIVDFIDSHPNGPQTVTQPSGNPRLREINDAYFEQTGKRLNQRTAAQITEEAAKTIDSLSDEDIQAFSGIVNIIEGEGLTLDNINEAEPMLRMVYGDETFETIKEELIFGNNGTSNNSRTEGQNENGVITESTDDTGTEGDQGTTESVLDKPVIEIDGESVDLSQTTPDQDAKIIEKGFNPIPEIQKGIDRLENATTAKWTSRITDAVAERMKAWRTSKSTAKQIASSYATSVFGGIARTAEDINIKLGLIGGKNMAVHNMSKIMKGLYDVVNNNVESLERVHVVLDPEFYQNTGQSNAMKPNVPPNLTYNDLTTEEKALYDEVRKNLDDVHFKNYTLGFIDVDTFNKYKDNYVPRMYETFELPSEVQEVLDQYQDQVGDKLNLNPFKRRKGLDELSDESKNAVLKDPVYLMAKRMMELDTNSAIMTFINHINRNNKNLVYQGDNPPFNYVKLEGKPYGALNGKYVPSFIAEDLKGYFFANKGLNTIYDGMKLYDRTWARKSVKKGLTVFNPFVQLGNFTSNIVFAQLSGIDIVRWFGNTPKAFTEMKQQGPLYEDLISAGLIGTDILKSDLMPNTEKSNSLLQTAQAKKDAGILNKVLKPLKWANNKAMELYSGNDDLAKLNSYMIFLDQGYSKEEATKKVYDGFQNYATVGKFWDVASKTPVFGNPFVKFPADLMRITGNAVTKKPLSSALYVAGLYMIPQILNMIGIGDDEEDDLEKDLRESRPFIPKMDLGVLNVPLVYKTQFGEVNLARYVTPYYFFDNGEDGALSSMMSRFNPIKTVTSEGYGKGNERTLPFGQDPVLGTMYNIMLDTDFRGKSIQDPDATRFRASGVTDEQKWTNRATHALRTWIPNGSLIHDTYLNAKYGEDFYGRTRTMAQSLVNFAVKIQDFQDSDYKKTAEKQLSSMVNDIKSQNETIKNTYATDARKRARLQESYNEGKIDTSDIQNSLEKLDDQLRSSIEASTKRQAELQKKLNEFTKKYERFLK